MEDPTTMEIGFPTLTATIPSTTPINFGLPADILQFYHTPVNTNELSIYNPGNIYISPTWQKINPTIINLPHSLPPVPKDIADLISPQQPTDPSPKDGWSYQPSLPSSNGTILLPMTIDMDTDATAEEPFPRPIPTRRPYCSPMIKEAYEQNDMLIEEIKLMYLKSGHSDDRINKLLMKYKTLPKKERPYKKRGTPCPK
uniref:Uncharacterized protein n=1 Tax=Panagrolaimus sp. PS1159 TaxID=55785 RepID=A0AC35G0Y1_9BILA